MFVNQESLWGGTWQSFERQVSRLLLYEGYEDIRLVGQTADGGADIIANNYKKRWLFQVKHWKRKVGLPVLDKTLEALRTYRADIPIIVSLNGFSDDAREHQRALMGHGTPLQFWDGKYVLERATALDPDLILNKPPRRYQETIINSITRIYQEQFAQRALVVMATGLGKTFVAAETIRRINAAKPARVLTIAHTNPLVYQLEKSFWPFLNPQQETLVWNQYERQEYKTLERVPFVFTCLNTIAEYIAKGGELPHFDIVLIDECHHVGGQMYEQVLDSTQAGKGEGPFLLGLTATPWRADDIDPFDYFGEPVATVDMVRGLKLGYLSNVDYRLYTDNIDWNSLQELKGSSFSPKKINKTLFINEWDDAVVLELQAVWKEQPNSRAIVFCGTIDHAIKVQDRINALGFCKAEAIYSQAKGQKPMDSIQRNRILCDFHDGITNVLCAVDVLNEGIDVPDVNIIVFQRVTHSRRIFVQQLGRGLRIAEGKEKIVVLDFVSDIRRFAAGLQLKDELESGLGYPSSGHPTRINLAHKVAFSKAGGEDAQTENFLRQWLDDIAAIEGAGENASTRWRKSFPYLNL